MNIVIITTPYYPEMSAPAACINKYIQQLKYKYSIDIINPIAREDFEPLGDPNLSLHYVSNRYWTWRMRCVDNRKMGKHVFWNRMFIQLFRIRTLLLGSFSYPTIQSWQLEAFYKELERIQSQKNIDVIISVVNPICSTFAALRFKERYPGVKWITYFTDPFTFHPLMYNTTLFKRLRKKRNYKWEKRIYDTADFNLFTAELYKSALSDFHQPLEKTICFKYILDRIKNKHASERQASSDVCKLLYAGSLYVRRRNPEFALSVVSRIDGIALDMYVPFGNCDGIIAGYQSGKIKRYPAVDRDRYNELISDECDILVNIGNNVTLQIPSKMLELLSTGRPILNFYQLKDSNYEMIERYPLGLNIGLNDPDAVEKVSFFCKEMKGKQLSFEEVEKLFPENTLSNQLAILERLINE